MNRICKTSRPNQKVRGRPELRRNSPVRAKNASSRREVHHRPPSPRYKLPFKVENLEGADEGEQLMEIPRPALEKPWGEWLPEFSEDDFFVKLVGLEGASSTWVGEGSTEIVRGVYGELRLSWDGGYAYDEFADGPSREGKNCWDTFTYLLQNASNGHYLIGVLKF